MNLTPDEYARLEQLFSEALDLAPSLRDSYLARVLETNGELIAAQLRALLAAHSDRTEPMFNPGLVLSTIGSAFRKGDLILNRFRIIRELGRGGMGEVYEAQDSELGRIALKTIRGDVTYNSSLLDRFKQEVRLARMVTSRHVCRIHEFFTLPGDATRPPIGFLTMEFLEGTTLADHIDKQGALPWREAEAIALQLCQGLDAMHAADIVHRDFKSRNIMLVAGSGEPRAVVMDLGLAYRTEPAGRSEPAHTPLTMAGAVVGTPDYMAPEQFESGVVSAATDIYALGIVLYEMATGQLPFEASTPMAAAVRRAKRPRTVSSIQPGVPHRWDAVIDKCLQYDPGRRFQSGAELAAALQKNKRPKHRYLALALASLLSIGLLSLGTWEYRRRTAHKVPDNVVELYRDATDSFNRANYLTASKQLTKAVKADPDFVLAHARLADAFNELDATGEAQRELNQIKQELVTELSSSEQTYIEAVRDTVRPDPAAALIQYRKLLGSARRSSERAIALVDLGRSDERAGKIADAIQSYTQAIQLAPNSPAPLLRRGILQSRQGKQKEADDDFAINFKILSGQDAFDKHPPNHTETRSYKKRNASS